MDMNFFRKYLVIGIIILFLGASVTPNLMIRNVKASCPSYIRYDDFEDYTVGEPPKASNGWSTVNVGGNNYIEARVDPLDSSNMVMLIHSGGSAPGCALKMYDFAPADEYVIHYRIYTPQLSMQRTVYEAYGEYPTTLVEIHRRTAQIRWGGTGCSFVEFSPPIDPYTSRWVEVEVRVTLDEFRIWYDNSIDSLGGYCNAPVNGADYWSIHPYPYTTQDFYIDDFWITEFNQDSGLVGYWSFDNSSDTGHDDSGNGNNGINYGATWISDGISGGALNFDGVNDYVVISDASDFAFSNQDLTFAAWVQIKDNANDYRNFISLGDPNYGNPHIALAKSRSAYWEGKIYMEIIDTESCWARTNKNGAELPKNTWLFLAGVVDYGDSIKLYLDGEIQEVNDCKNFDLSAAQSLRMCFGRSAKYSGYWPGYLNGIMDEIRIYNRALNDSEIQALYEYYSGVNIFHPIDDAEIAHTSPNTNFGLVNNFGVRNEYGSNPGWACDGLIKFDLSSIPSSSTILSASLNIHYFNWKDNNPSGRDLNLYRITSDWDEETVTWNTQPTYTSQKTTQSDVPSSTGVWMEWEVTNDIQDFVDDQVINHGWKITDENYWGGYNIPISFFLTKEYGSYIPYLRINYVSPSFAFYAVDGGKAVWESTDYGVNWTEVNSEFDDTGSKAMVSDSSGNLYITTAVSEISKSIDDGRTWTVINNDYNGGEVKSDWLTMACSKNDDYIYIIEKNGDDVWRSTDFGITWTKVNDNYNGGLNPQPKGADTDSDGNIFLVDGNADVWKSADNGVTWTKINDDYNGPRTNGAADYVIGDDVHYIVMGVGGASYVYKSTDGGVNFEDMGKITQFGGVQALTYSDGKIYSVIFYGNGPPDIHRSDDDATSWSIVGEISTAYHIKSMTAT